jgi:hypothetical protein
MFATLLMLYRNYEKWAGLNTQGSLHQQPRKDPVNRLILSSVLVLISIFDIPVFGSPVFNILVLQELSHCLPSANRL